jgi:hypothetical protein
MQIIRPRVLKTRRMKNKMLKLGGKQEDPCYSVATIPNIPQIVCRICRESKNNTDMVINHTTPVKIHYKDICKPCSTNKSRIVNRLRKIHAYPDEQYQCPICLRQANKYYLDHDWATGSFRGWLCNGCNVSLGLLKDNVDNLKRAIAYLSQGTPQG